MEPSDPAHVEGGAARVSASGRATRRTSGSSIGARKQPRQARSKQLVDAVLQAAAEVFAEHGYARANTNRIAERAGVSVGSLYQYFPNKDSLLAGLLAQHHADVARVVDGALVLLADPTVPIEDCLRRLVQDLVALHDAKPTLTKALSAATLRDSSLGEGKPDDVDGEARARLAATLLASRPDVRRADDPAAMTAVVSQTTEQLTRWLVHDAPGGLARAALVDEVVRLLVRFLQA
jgi:AcrR family transcriptional regulator